MKLSIIFLLCAFSVTAVTATKVYKWVDKDGNIHYSEKKPANQQADTLKIKAAKPAPTPEKSEPVAKTDPVQDADSETSQQRAEAEKTLAAADKINQQKLCQQAKANRDALNASVRVARIDPETGEQVRMSDEERVNALQQAEQTIKEYCQ
ncbi:DUF4124 domain-containing protein [Marinicella gelatinilytica]|uniref:DUF4124 domain-containing protein n=1 Tax=Marinicella gelatinilytica TaxID=2996017 RepID=UPI002260986F|nr:DUF4124 domain-containing protein [Marinicella gelatinilytica]MCX7544052.1 DUF4124 domain-containing protein [Marinicella gelatinilytica]